MLHKIQNIQNITADRRTPRIAWLSSSDSSNIILEYYYYKIHLVLPILKDAYTWKGKGFKIL